MSNITVATYIALTTEYKDLTEKAKLQNGEELDATMNRLREIARQLKEVDASIPRWTGFSTNYQNQFTLIGMAVQAEITKQVIDNSLYSKEEYRKGIRDAFFVGCIVGCTAIALAFYIVAFYQL